MTPPEEHGEILELCRQIHERQMADGLLLARLNDKLDTKADKDEHDRLQDDHSKLKLRVLYSYCIFDGNRRDCDLA